jgi:hypothetical protein
MLCLVVVVNSISHSVMSTWCVKLDIANVTVLGFEEISGNQRFTLHVLIFPFTKDSLESIYTTYFFVSDGGFRWG